jgi:microsomal dipeptidase-like Zn-dependent dipeptidase
MKKVNIKYQVLPIHDPKYIAIADLSTWSYLSEKPSEVDIKIAGYSNFVTLEWKKDALNIFNSYNLQQNCKDCGDELVDLPDGIYEIVVKGKPSSSFSETSKFIRTYLMNLEIDKVLISTDFSCGGNEEVMEKLQEIDFLIKSAEANVRYDNISKAAELMELADKRLKKLKNCS